MSFTFVNIIGYGYMGSAICHLCKNNNVHFCTYGGNEKRAIMNSDNLDKLVEYSELYNELNVYFICVDSQNVETILEQLYDKVKSNCNTVIIKTPINSGTTRKLSEKYSSKLEIFLCPEFLSEHNYKEGMYNQNFCLIGSSDQDNYTNACDIMRTIYKHKEINIICKTYEECENGSSLSVQNVM